MHHAPTLRRALTALLLAAAGVTAHAAGGHHAVDDATILEEGRCELETWAARGADHADLLHAGASCRVGPVQAGFAGEHVGGSAAPSQSAWGLEAKWARELVDDTFSIGAVLQPAWQAHVRPRYQGVTFAALATWTPREDLALHANLGHDFVHQGPDRPRGGVALEWQPAKAWSLLAERYLEQDTHYLRGGVRYLAGETWSVDVSRAQRLAGPGVSTWTVGLTLGFARP
jgi:hypothetical protein